MTNITLNNTKRKLTIIFTLIVFSFVSIFWIIYFSGKYYAYVKFEESQFEKFYSNIDFESLDIDQITEFLVFQQKRNFNKWDVIWKIHDNRDKNHKPFEFMNYYIVDNNNEVIINDVKDDISLDLLNEILEKDKYFSPTINWNYLIKKFKLKDWNTILFYREIFYNLNNYFKDVFWFVFILVLISIFIYKIWYIFVDKTLKPVENNMKEMEDFIHNVWHELKTPISVIDSDIQMMKELKKYDKEMISEIKWEVKRLNSLIDALINLSDINSFKNVSNLNLREISDTIISDFGAKISEKNISVENKIPENIEINANIDYFYMFLSNLIWNAIKYNKKDWKIKLAYKSWILSIKDTWIGINSDEIDKIFERFYKTDKSRNSEWFGIWLSLVKKIADVYAWKIDIKSEEGKWSEFMVKM